MNTKEVRAKIGGVLVQLGKRLALVGGIVLCLCSSACGADKERDPSVKMKVANFRMYISEVLKQEVLREINAKDKKNRILELANWDKSPLEVRSVVGKGSIRIRFEEDFIVIWHRRADANTRAGKSALELTREGTRDLLSEAFVLGEATSLVGTDSTPDKNGELVMTIWPKPITGTKAVTCSYHNVDGGARRWRLVARVHILAKGRDAIIVVEKKKARRLGVDEYHYPGLKAGKVRLRKELAKELSDKPVTARNFIFARENDVSAVPDVLLNACMWSPDRGGALEVRDIGPASDLCPRGDERRDNAKVSNR